MPGPRVAIIFYSLYGHITCMAQAEKAGIEKAGGTVDLFQVAETLPQDVLTKMHAPPKPDIPVINPGSETILNYDAFLFGVPTRYGNFPAQWKTFWDATGKFWLSGGLAGKYVGMFCSTGTPGGGQETTFLSCMSTMVHHGMIYVPLGYAHTSKLQTDLEEVHGGSPWGAGTYAGSSGERQPTTLEKKMAEIQGKAFWEIVSRVKFDK
ncbi:NADH-quinone oxidoreductase [Coprinopsis marcescibilis]|uniref:NADH-quinone oxidoreductase n=1 Tax=Coprinopsis marcescibilis TaxID=230819 RepID=A0A5C3KSC8_COPMA|nr:NADH-quinone oxidoreductase [Coprinopsis marcescibilis]